MSDMEERESELSDSRWKTPKRTGTSAHGIVSTAHKDATAAGVRILAEGGNAVDAAVAAAIALGVCEPAASGLGGQTMMMIHLARTRRTVALDGSSRAPYRAAPGSLDSGEIRRGYRATTVPSTPATLEWAREHFGSMSMAKLAQPAIELAADGYVISPLQHALTKREAKHLRGYNAASVFLKDGKRPYPVGTTLKQPALADTLRRLASKGVEDFYTGRIARAIHRDMVANGGLVQKEDLAQIPWPIERRPVGTHFGKWRVMTAPPPAAGPTLVEVLNILGHLPRKKLDPDTPEGAVLLSWVLQQAFQDRTDRPRDRHLYGQIRKRVALSDGYAREVANLLRRRRIRMPATSGDTTHLSVVDGKGNFVALTQSIERVYGSCVMTPELGFLYNNYLMAYEHQDFKHPYYLRPGGVPWASVAPAILFENGRARAAIGSPGSERIVSAVSQVLLRMSRGYTAHEAIDAPRLHCSLAGKVSIEAARVSDDVIDALEETGFEIVERDPYSFYLGCVQLVQREGGRCTGVADPRRDGSARGPKDAPAQRV